MKRTLSSLLFVTMVACSWSSASWAQSDLGGPGFGRPARLVGEHAELLLRRSNPYRVADPLPADAQQLVEQLQEREAAIQARAAAESQAVREGVIAQMRVLLDRYTKAGDLDHALAIRDRIRALEPAVPFVARPSVPSLYEYRGQVGKTLTITVTGSASGIVWGSDIYTDDSDVSTAAVHAGLLKVGETGAVTITILSGMPAYTGSSRNGITSSSYPSWDGSYHIARANRLTATSTPIERSVPEAAPEMLYGVGRIGDVLTFKLTGSADGYVWGTGPYTDDSKLSSAAVHAGVLDVGQTGLVSVRIVEGQDSYAGASRNGIESRPYSQWERGIVFVSGPKRALKYQVTIEPAAKPDPGTQSHTSSTRNGVASYAWENWYTSFRVERLQPVGPSKDSPDRVLRLR